MNQTLNNMMRAAEASHVKSLCVGLLLLVTYVALCCDHATAGQLRLRSEVRPVGALVVLGDVAEILTNSEDEAQRLAAIELFPAPTGVRKRFLNLPELRDLLQQRQVDLADITFAGASRITVHGFEMVNPEPEAEPVVEAPHPIAPVMRTRIENQVREAVIEYLRQKTQVQGPWTVRFSLEESQIRSLVDNESDLFVSGGQSPWTGSQHFLITADQAEGQLGLRIDAIVTLPPAVVVAARPLSRGNLIQEGDVRLEVRSDVRDTDVTFASLDQVIGLETKQSIAAGEAMVDRKVQQPVLVKSGDIVTVFARSGGIQVRTVARARESGSMGELVSVEALNDRKSYFARVSGIQKVEIYARAVAADRSNLEEQASGPINRMGVTSNPPSYEQTAVYQQQVARAVQQYQQAVAANYQTTSEPPVNVLRTSNDSHSAPRQTARRVEVIESGRETNERTMRTNQQTAPQAVSNPTTPTRLRWTRRSEK